MKKNSLKLALFGGSKIFGQKKEHYIWPPKQDFRVIRKYLQFNYLSSKGYPFIVEKFEKTFAKLIGSKFALATNSGTSALHAAYFALDIKKNDEVILPTLTFHATGTPLLKFTKNIKFCGCDEVGNININELKNLVTQKTKLVVVTHLGGHPCEMDKIMRLKKKYNFKLVEDCSHAHESKYKGRKVGTFGEINIFSMDRNKLLSVGEGGVLVTNSQTLFEKSLLVTDFGPRIQNEIKLKKNKIFKESGFGFKHRIHPVAAAIALSELTKLKKYIKMRHARLNYISKKLNKISGLTPPITKKYVNRGAFYSYRIVLNDLLLKKTNLSLFIKALNKEGLNARTSGNRPLHQLPYFKICKPKRIISAEKFYNSTVSIPTFTFENYKVIDLYIKGFEKVCNYFNEKK
jgi:perosamine synthetase